MFAENLFSLARQIIPKAKQINNCHKGNTSINSLAAGMIHKEGVTAIPNLALKVVITATINLMFVSFV